MSIWSFGISGNFTECVTTAYHTRYHTCYHTFTENFAPFLLVVIFSTLPEVLLNIVLYIFSKISI